MKQLASFLSLRKNYDALFFSLAGLGMILLFCHYGGIGVSPDSVVYTSTARNIHNHWRAADYNNMPIIDFPVAYPAFLAFAYFVTWTDPFAAGPYINGVLFGLLIYICGCMMQRWKHTNRWYRLFILSCIAISPSLMEIYTMLWSETLFIFWSIVFMALLRHYFTTHRLLPLLAVGICASLACITRYAGVTLIGTGGLLLLLDDTLPWKKKTGHILLFGLSSISLLVTNLYVNYTISHTLTGPREKGVTPFIANLHYFSTVMCDWLPFMRNHYTFANIIGASLILLAGYFILIRWLRKKSVLSYENIATVFFFVYACFMLLSATISRYEPINNRLLSPLYIPMLWTFTGWVPRIQQRLSAPVRRRFFALTLVAAILFQLGQYSVTHFMYLEVADFGIPGYTDDSWRLSTFSIYLKQHPGMFRPGFSIYSNDADGLYIGSGITGTSLPHINQPGDMNDFLTNPFHYVVWFNNTDDPDLASQAYILSHKNAVPIYQSRDGIVYWCSEK